MTDTQQPSVTQADIDLGGELRCRELTKAEIVMKVARHREQATADMRVENERLQKCLEWVQYEACAATSSDGKERDPHAIGRIDSAVSATLLTSPAVDAGLDLDSDFPAEEDGAGIERVQDALRAGIRAAQMALFVMKKRNVRLNSSWEAGVNGDIAFAEVVLSVLNGAQEQQP